ncbi:MAG TPA: hypothetical protein VGG88_11890 [Gaiellaceae bacterium]
MPASPDPADQTRRVPLPPSETGPVPVSVSRAEVRWFGVPPLGLLVGVAVFTLAIALALLAGGSWAIGLGLLGIAALLGAAFLQISEAGIPAWVPARLEILRARSGAIAESQRVHASRAVIESERRMARLRLGEAERSDDEEAARTARERLSELDRSEAALAGRAESRRAEADERIRRVRFSTEETMIVTPKPEPYPPPDEGDPPVPAPIPEPSPQRGEDSRRPAA